MNGQWSHPLVLDDVLVWTVLLVSAKLIQRTPVTPPCSADTSQTPETHIIIRIIAIFLCNDWLLLGVLLGALVQSTHGSTVVEGHVSCGDADVIEHQGNRQDHVICRQKVTRQESVSRSEK